MAEIKVGRWYPLGRGSWAKVLRYDPQDSPTFPYLVQSFFIRARWWCDSTGEPNNHVSPKLIVR